MIDPEKELELRVEASLKIFETIRSSGSVWNRPTAFKESVEMGNQLVDKALKETFK
mgnify:CR=1 FL=1